LEESFEHESRLLVTYKDRIYLKGFVHPTRFFGGMFLQDEGVNQAMPEMYHITPFNGPYISMEPSVTCVARGDVSFLVVGSDGVWDHVSPKNAKYVLQDASFRERLRNRTNENSSKPINLAHLLNIDALERSCAQVGRHYQEVKESVPEGKERRLFHDDITSIVVAFD
jgi:serine/threonine protein phosphatase PrpC